MELQTELRLEVIPDESFDAKDKRALLERERTLLTEAARGNGVKAELPEAPAPEGSKGPEIAIGAIILTPIVAESVKWLFEYIKSKVDSRARQGCTYKVIFTKGGVSKILELKASGPAGENTTFDIKASNLTDGEIKKLVEVIEGLSA